MLNFVLFNGLRSDLLSNVNKLDLNECLLQRITESWDESSVTWVNQPETTSENEVRVGRKHIQTARTLSIDITELLIDLQRIENFGLNVEARRRVRETKRQGITDPATHFHSEFHPELLIEYEVERELLLAN